MKRRFELVRRRNIRNQQKRKWNGTEERIYENQLVRCFFRFRPSHRVLDFYFYHFIFISSEKISICGCSKMFCFFFLLNIKIIHIEIEKVKVLVIMITSQRTRLPPTHQTKRPKTNNERIQHTQKMQIESHYYVTFVCVVCLSFYRYSL